MTSSRGIRFGLYGCLAALVICAAVLAAFRAQERPEPSRYENSIQAAFRYLDHVSLNSARNGVRRAIAAGGRSDDTRLADSLIEALETLRKTGRSEALERIGESHPGNPSVQLALGRLARSKGDPRAAKRHLERALEDEPDNAAAWLALSEVLAGTGERDEAMDALERAYEYRGKFDYISWHYARALLERGGTAEALPILSGLAERHPAKLEYTLQYLLAADEKACEPAVQELLARASTYFSNDLTMRLGDNGETWNVVHEGASLRLESLEDKRLALSQLESSVGNAACDTGR